MPTLPTAVRRIVVIAIPGGRLEGRAIQTETTTEAWPFATNARLAAARKPDLVIHVGDYYYRRSACRRGAAAVRQSTRRQLGGVAGDLFDPAAPAARRCTLVTVRGNHELCPARRSGLVPFDGAAGDAGELRDMTEPYRIRPAGSIC